MHRDEREPVQAKTDNKYAKRIEDIDPAHLDPSAMVEYHEKLALRPSPYTVEGYIQGFADLSEAAVNGTGQRRSRARMLVFMSLAALFALPASELLGLLHVW
jgi:hypothetical protein